MTAQLQTLVRLRQYELDRGQIQLANALQFERELAKRLAEIDQQVESHRTQLAALMRGRQLNIDALRLRHQYQRGLGEQLREVQCQLETAQRTTQEARSRVLVADQRLQVAKELRERALVEACMQRQRSEELATEDRRLRTRT